MIWLVLILAAICLMMLRYRSQRDSEIEQSNNQQAIPLAATVVDVDAEDECLIAVITAAIHEFTGTVDFEVVKIKQSAAIWTLTGRQNMVANR